MSSKPCIFCKIVDGSAPAELAWSDDVFLAFLDINPIAPGHLLVIPREHISSVFELDPPRYTALFDRARMLADALQRTFQSRRVGLAIEGFGVDHAHVHLVPIQKLGDLDPRHQKRAAPGELRDARERLQRALRAP